MHSIERKKKTLIVKYKWNKIAFLIIKNFQLFAELDGTTVADNSEDGLKKV